MKLVTAELILKRANQGNNYSGDFHSYIHKILLKTMLNSSSMVILLKGSLLWLLYSKSLFSLFPEFICHLHTFEQMNSFCVCLNCKLLAHSFCVMVSLAWHTHTWYMLGLMAWEHGCKGTCFARHQGILLFMNSKEMYI